MDEVIKFLAISIVAALLAIILRRESPVFAFLVSLAAGVAVISFAAAFFRPIHTFLMSAADAAGLFPAVTTPLFKALGIALLTKICSAVLDDAGERALSSYVEIAGAASAVYVSLPLLSSAFDMLRSLI